MAKKWIQKAVAGGKGKLRKELGVKKGKKISAKDLSVKKSDSPVTKKRKVLAKTLSGFKKKKSK